LPEMRDGVGGVRRLAHWNARLRERSATAPTGCGSVYGVRQRGRSIVHLLTTRAARLRLGHPRLSWCG